MEEFFEAIEELRYSSTLGAYGSSLYATSYLETRGSDVLLLRFLDEARARYPGDAMLLVPLMAVSFDFGLYALSLDAVERMEYIDYADGEAALEIERVKDACRRDMESRDLSWTEDKSALVALDEARWKLLVGREDEALRGVAAVLSERPLWIPALEERALLAWDACRFDEAESAFRDLLGVDSRSLSALAGLIRLLVLLDRPAEAAPYASRLIEPEVFDPESIQCLEAAVLARAQAKAGFSSDGNPYLAHLSAALSAMRGDESAAKRLWSVGDDSRVDELRELNLDDLGLEPALRRGPFVLRLIDLVPTSCKMPTLVGDTKNEIEVEHAIDAMIGALRTKAGALVPGLVKVLFALGDPTSIKILVERILVPWFPDLDDFVLRQSRDEALPEPRRGLVRSFLEASAIGAAFRSKEKETVALKAWNVSWDAMELPSPLQSDNEHAFVLLKSEDYQSAAKLYRSLLLAAPYEPSLKNNLRYALDKMGHKEEVALLAAEMRRESPGYIPLQIEESRELLNSGDADRANRILDGLLARDSFHGDELRSVLKARIDIYLHEEKIDNALSWYEIWRKIEIDEDKLLDYPMLAMMVNLKRLETRRRPRKAGRKPAPKQKNPPPEPRREEKGRDDGGSDDQLSLFDE
jgi:Putative Zn-dependent protease, contains TPR repeats